VSIEQAIHAHWAQCQELAALVPADRLTTGRPARDVAGCATLERTATRPCLPTNNGYAIEEVALRVVFWHDDYDAGHAILEAVVAALDGVALEMDGGARWARLRRTDQSTTHEPDGRWVFHVRLSARIHQ